MISETCAATSSGILQASQEKRVAGKPRAVGLLSGGLDSTIAALLVRDLGVEVYGLCFALPWGCCSKDKEFHSAAR